jgi:hypothetical protein
VKTKRKAYVKKKTKDAFKDSSNGEQKLVVEQNQQLTEEAQLEILADIIIHVLLKQVK